MSMLILVTLGIGYIKCQHSEVSFQQLVETRLSDINLKSEGPGIRENTSNSFLKEVNSGL